MCVRFSSHSSAGAFTLLELLVVVAVISLLSTIALSNVQEAKKRAEIAQCAGNLKAIGTALAAYKMDYGEYPPADGTAGRTPSPNRTEVGNGPAAGGSWAGVPWAIVQLRYLDSPDALYCPTLRARYPKRAENFRYAYNYSARDTGGPAGGAGNVEVSERDLWLARCVYLPCEAGFNPEVHYEYPHGDDPDGGRYRHDVMENVLFTNQRVELRNGQLDHRAAARR